MYIQVGAPFHNNCGIMESNWTSFTNSSESLSVLTFKKFMDLHVLPYWIWRAERVINTRYTYRTGWDYGYTIPVNFSAETWYSIDPSWVRTDILVLPDFSKISDTLRVIVLKMLCKPVIRNYSAFSKRNKSRTQTVYFFALTLIKWNKFN